MKVTHYVRIPLELDAKQDPEFPDRRNGRRAITRAELWNQLMDIPTAPTSARVLLALGPELEISWETEEPDQR